MVRQGELKDFDAIVNIRESVAIDVGRLEEAEYRVQVQRRGFLLPTGLSITDFEANLSDYNVAERSGVVVGYLRFSEEHDISSGAEAFWLRPDLKDTYFENPHAYICGIGVLPGTGRRGVGREMLEVAEQRTLASNNPWLFSVIVTSPVTNIASMLFHEKNGFERVAMLELTEEAGLENFQNLVYAKQLM